MAILTCERCGKQTAKITGCTYCSKKLCISCIKSSRRFTKTKPLFICKDCWSDMKVRKKFKATPARQWTPRD